MNSAVIQSPGFGFGRQKTLKDIAVYTGAEIYNNKSKLNQIKFGKSIHNYFLSITDIICVITA